jgi:tetratricopeptide (TPR) repeat protein
MTAPGEPHELPADEDEREGAYGLLARAEALMTDRHHAQAAILLERAIRLEPGRASLVEALARARYNAGHHREALDAWEELLRLEPASAYGHFGLGQSLKQVGRRDEARTHLRLAVALSPASPLFRSALDRLG